MLFKSLSACAAAIILLMSSSGARAQILDEVLVGDDLHDVVNITDGVESSLQDVQLEIDSKRPSVLRFIGAPRLNGFVTFNGAHESDVVGGGLVWDHRVFRRLFVTLDFGLGYSDGVVDPPPGRTDDDHYRRLLLGSDVLFRTAPGIEWHLDDHWVAGGQFIHLSNADLLGSHHFNRGINDAGLRIGYRFP